MNVLKKSFIVRFSLVLMLVGLLSFGCNRDSSSYSGGYESTSYDPVDHERSEAEVREDLATREASSPASYLSFEGSYRKNLFGEMVIEGSISNSASVAKFKDAVLQVEGYSKTDSKIGVWEETVYEVFAPGRSKQIKIKMLLPSDVQSVRVGVFDAIALN